MESRFQGITYRYGYCGNILQRFKKRTTLSLPQIYLTLDFFIYFLRKLTIEKEYINILLFGNLYLKHYKYIIVPKFYLARSMRKCVNGTLEYKKRRNSGLYIPSLEYKEIFIYAKKFLKLKKRDSIYLFNLLIEGIMQEIIDNDIVKVRNIGFFYTEIYKSSTTSLFGKPGNYKRKKVVKFIPANSFKDEANGNIEEYKMNKQLKKLFDFYDFPIKVKDYDKKKTD